MAFCKDTGLFGGYGTTFNRPDFIRLIDDVEKGMIDTIIVKDLSRVGRDYLRVGYYTEIIFPDNNVGFISISDNVNSTQGENDFMPFHNLMNEWYARDISRKQKAVIQSKGNSGVRLRTRPHRLKSTQKSMQIGNNTHSFSIS